ncbi:MAG: hypothetical protein PHI32_05865 [Dysgonamonadaceae bacterium]|nr:hypothetical protein [Dysgonamonadaceae bacterium]
MIHILSKILRIFAIIVVLIVLINILLFITLSIPAVQRKATDFALSKIKPIVNTEVRIGKINLKLLNSVQLGEVYIEDQKQDTLLYARKIDVQFNPFGLLKNKLQFYSASLEDFTANVYRETPDTTFNFQFIIDAFASDDPKPKDPDSTPLLLRFDRIRLKNGIGHYHINSEPQTPSAFNASHIDVYNLNANINAPSIDMEKLDVTIKSLSLWEHSGFTIDKLNIKIRSEGSRLMSNKLKVNLNSSQIKASDIVYDLETKEFAINAKSEDMNPADIAIFSPRFSHLNKPFSIDADLKGKLPQVDINTLLVEYGTTTKINIDGKIADYSQYGDADVSLNIKELRTTQSDLDAFIKIGNDKTELPDQVKALGNMNLRLTANGSLKRLNIQGQVNTEPGSVRISGFGAIDTTFSNYSFDGRLVTNNLNTAMILGESVGLDLVSATINAKVVQSSNKPLSVVADGNLSSLVYNEFNFKNINFTGSYSDNNIEANINTDTSDNKFDIHAKLLGANGMDITVQGVIDKLTLEPFYTQEGWQNAMLTAEIDGHFTGSSIDDLVGNLVIDNTSLSEESFIYNPGPIYLQSLVEDNEKVINLFTSFLEAEIKGDYYFSTIAQEFKQLMQPHLPSLLGEQLAETDFKNDFKFVLRLKNTEDLSFALSLPFYNIEEGTITGQINMPEQQSNVNVMVPRLMFGTNDIRQTKVDLKIGEQNGIDLNANTYLVQDDGYINGKLNTHAASDSVINSLFFDMNNNVIKTNGELRASIGFNKETSDDLMTNILIHPATILFNNKEVHIMEGTVKHTKEYIEIRDFGIMHSGSQQFGIDGIASKNIEDSVRVFFDSAELANILTAFNIKNIQGTIDGDLVVRQALKDPIVHTDHFNISNIRTDKDTIGTLYVESLYNPLEDGLKLDVYIKRDDVRNLSVTGFIPTSEGKEMDIDMIINQLPLRWVQPFAIATFSKLEGTISSKIDVSGKTSEPIIEGWLGIDEGLLKVDYTNVEYRISDTIRVNRDNVGFKDLLILDDNGNSAKIGLVLNHSNFGRLDYKAKITLDDFMLLNNPDRTDLMAHGTLKLNGDISINGSQTGIFGTADLSNGSKSKVKIELPQTATATEYKGVIYINTPNEVDSLSFLKKRDEGKSILPSASSSDMLIDMRVTINLDPDLDLGVQYNPRTGDAIAISGTGELNVNFNSKSDPQVRIYGEYVAEDGEASHNLQGLKKINFKVKEGSKLSFMGDPLRTQFNITAYHQVKADLATLSESFSHDTNVSNTRVPVNALLEIRGDLDAMELYYDIELPEASQDVQRKVESLISTEEARIRQFAYLVTTNSFYGASSNPDLNFGNDMFTNLAANALSKGLDALFASALNENWSISTNLKSQNGSFDDVRMGVDVSTRLFDDKLRVSTNLSYGDAQLYDDQQSFIGEFELEYDLTNWLMLRAFNKANERYYKLAPTTQGAGVVINKEAKRFKDLFKFRFFQRKKKRTIGNNSTSISK